jgi:hypothetical protein
MKPIFQLEYRSEHPRPTSVVLPFALLILVGGIIWLLHELAIAPYRPPYDMSTLLDGPEEAFVHFLISVFVVGWATILVWCISRLRRKLKHPRP